eukprot:5998923-Lingulodinium_polyedra.AAC.1
MGIETGPVKRMRQIWRRLGIRHVAQLAVWIRRHERRLGGDTASAERGPDPVHTRAFACLHRS